MKRAAEEPKQLSCQRCRLRKIKCSLGYPCSKCTAAGVECVQVRLDKRTKRPAANYVAELEAHIARLRAAWEEVRAAPPAERLALLESVTAFEERNDARSRLALPPPPLPLPPPPPPRPPGQYSRSSYSRSSAPRELVYGPTSVYQNDLLDTRLQHHDGASVEPLHRDPQVLHCIKTFFTWQYPGHCMFLFREAFLTDFFNPQPRLPYCLRELVLAICALGARMTDDAHERAPHFYAEARALLLARLDTPLVAALQAFLLLAFYDLCSGANLAAWMLSGNAFRMGYDLGFQLDPHVWFVKARDGELLQLEVAIRSRIFWGLYVADHFISLLLGRPLVLKRSEATIPETDYLPDLEWIDEYMYHDPRRPHTRQEMLNVSLPLKSVITLINISEGILADIFAKADDDSLASRLGRIAEYNRDILRWKRELPRDLAWDHHSGDNPVLLSIRYYYYILVLCLNRPFVGQSERGEPSEPREANEAARLSIASASMTQPHSQQRPSQQPHPQQPPQQPQPSPQNSQQELAPPQQLEELAPADICEAAILELHAAIATFSRVHGLRQASIFIVYCSILAVSILLLTSPRQLHRRHELDFFMEVLQGCSKTWPLAEKLHRLIAVKLKSLDEPPLPAPAPAPAPSPPALEESLDFFGGPPVLMTSDLFNEDWEALFPDYIFN